MSNDPLMKQCRICKAIKEKYNFPILINAYDGLDSRCYICKRQQKTPTELDMLRKKVPGDYNEFSLVGEKKCNLCDQFKPKYEFARQPSYRDGYNAKCKQCVKESRKLTDLDIMRQKLPENLQT